MDEDKRLATPAEATALASALRLRIIRLTQGRALTNKELADRLDRDPATVLYHVRKLVAAGFLVALPARHDRGMKEIPYESTGLSWRIRPDTRARRSPAIAEAMLEAFLMDVADNSEAPVDQTRLVLQLDEAGRDALWQELRDVLERFAGQPPRRGGQRVAVYLATYPTA